MPDIRHSLQIAAAPAALYALVSTPQGLSRWWAADITPADGAWDLGFFGRTTVYRLRHAASEAPSHFQWLCETGQEWAGTHIDFRIQPAGSGSLLRFTHGGWQADTDYFISCNTVWGELMFRLKASAEGNAVGPLFLPDGLAKS